MAPILEEKVCQTCMYPMKWINPGVSKKTGKPYNGFWACPNKCKQPFIPFSQPQVQQTGFPVQFPVQTGLMGQRTQPISTPVKDEAQIKDIKEILIGIKEIREQNSYLLKKFVALAESINGELAIQEALPEVTETK